MRTALGVGTPRERYVSRLRQAGLDETSLGARWLAAGDSAARASATVTPPFREAGYFDGRDPRAVAYRWLVRRGQRAIVIVAAEGDSSGSGPALFVDSWRRDTSGALHRAASLDSASGMLDLVAEEDGEMVVRLQPEALRAVRYVLTIRIAPLARAFPVSGRDERAARSFWGASRDAGARSHQGVDIFAARGTPVVAATGGVVTSVGENRLGGKVVWVVEPGRRWSFYYAHLDRQLVSSGRRVRPGDTLGLVGNTGNARSTPPHLHFGVYRTGRRGAVDPWPFLARPRGDAEPVSAPLAALGTERRVTRGDAAGAVGSVLAVRGARYVVRLADGRLTEVAATAVAPLASLGARATAAGTPLRTRPVASALVLARIGPDERTALLGRSGGWCLLETPRARGWAACA
jgi:murein DD-endopeptidase MepM/ murein hydrolase activator NlpD